MVDVVVTRILPRSHKGDLAIALAMLQRLHRSRGDWNLRLVCHDADADRALFEPFGSVHSALFPATGGGGAVAKTFRLLRYLAWGASGLVPLDSAGERFCALCQASDALVFCGGGSPGGYGIGNLLRHAFAPALIAARTRVPVVYTGLGIEPVSAPLHRFLMRRVLNGAALVLARDPIALANLGDLGVTATCELAADWALDLDSAAPATVEQALETEGVGRDRELRVVMNLRDEGASGPEGRTRKSTPYAGAMSTLLRLLLDATAAQVVVVSMTRTPRTDDVAFARRLRASLPAERQARVHVLAGDHDPALIKGIIGSADVFIGTRLHPTIFAVSQAVPTLALHDFSKVRGFMAYCGLSEWLLPPLETPPERMLGTLTRLIEQRAQVSRQIAGRLPALFDAVDRNVEGIERTIDAARER